MLDLNDVSNEDWLQWVTSKPGYVFFSHLKDRREEAVKLLITLDSINDIMKTKGRILELDEIIKLGEADVGLATIRD